jgi:N-formylglutamate amidohydrolase
MSFNTYRVHGIINLNIAEEIFKVAGRILVHIPHSSTHIPDDLFGSFSADPDTIRRNIVALTDYAVNQLFDSPGHQNQLIFPVSRLICDVERFRNDADEIMASRGMGAVYTHGAYGEVLRSYNEELRSSILARYYDPHHQRLWSMVSEAIEENGLCVIVDAHSFPSRPLPTELDQSTDRYDFCIGTDECHTPCGLSALVRDYIQSLGFSVSVNKPYQGTMVPLPMLGTTAPIRSIMIEVNRRLYMDEANQQLIPRFIELKDMMGALLDTIEEWAKQN